MHHILRSVSWDVCFCVCALESLHPAVRSICQLLWLPVGSRAEDDEACYSFCPCWRVCTWTDCVSGLKCLSLNQNVFGVRVLSYTGECGFVCFCLVPVSMLVWVSMCQLQSPLQSWFMTRVIWYSVSQRHDRAAAPALPSKPPTPLSSSISSLQATISDTHPCNIQLHLQLLSHSTVTL